MSTDNARVSASLEDYLEAIFHTVDSKGAARAKDIVLRMGVNNSSVTQALRLLSEKELVNYAPYDVITLTDSGEKIALDVVRRHEIMRRFLTEVLGLPGAEADEGACRMEHAISGPILERLVQFVDYFETCPLNGVRWDEEIGFFCAQNTDEGDNGSCSRDICPRSRVVEPETGVED
jgi:DtxR family transcriptional regulator, Mn-dependent transcriptional regulator